jgi:hypothetical protein
MNLVAMAFILLWFALLVLLHFLKPNFNPSSHTCSEYAIGKFGFLMQIAFFAMAAGNLLIAILFWQSKTVATILFSVVSLGFVGLGIWRADLTISEEKETTAGKLHLLSGFVAMVLIDVLSVVFAAQYQSILLVTLAALIIASHIAFIASMNIMRITVFGIAQRVYIALITIWLIAVTTGLMGR